MVQSNLDWLRGTMASSKRHYGFLLAFCIAAACGRSEQSGADKREQPQMAGAETATHESARVTLAPWRSLLGESLRAERDEGGIFIDFGTADQHKYTRGGWSTGWGDPAAEQATSYCTANEAVERLDVETKAPATEVVLRARSAIAGQTVAVLLDGKERGSAALGADWQVVRVPLGEPAAAAGRHLLELAFTKGKEARAEVDWLWLAKTAGANPPTPGPRSVPMKIGGDPRRALASPSPRTYRFFLQVPEGASLVVDIGAKGESTFVVRARADGMAETELFRGTSPGKWTEERIDLAKLGGKAVALELATEGAPGPAGWAEPEIMLHAAPEKAVAKRGGKPKNVILIMIDTARADSFAPFGDGATHTPTYDALIPESTVFANAYNNENWTKPSVATLLSGLYPSTHDTKRDDSKLPREVELLPQRLQSRGFKTAGLIANGYISEHFGFKKGWDHYRNYIREGAPNEAEHLYHDALGWLEKNKDEPFFLYIQPIDPHVPNAVDSKYTAPYFEGEYGGPLGKEIDDKDQRALSTGKLEPTDADVAWLRAVYKGEVTYQDEQMGHFLDQVRAWGLLDDTLLVVTNDHGEELYEYGKVGHGHSLNELMMRAPLLMHYPPLFPPGKVVKEVVEQVDVTPTIFDALGLPPQEHADGTSLLPLVRGKPNRRPYYAIMEFLSGRRAVRVGSWKLMRDGGDWAQLYNVVADPKETEDLLAKSPVARRMCDVYLGEGLGMPSKRERLQDLTARRHLNSPKVKIGPATRRGLEALGYFGDH